VVWMGLYNTKLERTVLRKQKLKLRGGAKRAGTLPRLHFDRV